MVSCFTRDTGEFIIHCKARKGIWRWGMKVKELLATKGKDVVSVDAHYTVEDAVRSMNARKISALMVNDNGKTVGILTERDVVRCYIANDGKSFKEVPIRDAMTTDLMVAEMGDDLSDVMAIMVEKNIRHLPVIEDGQVIGMLSIRDIVQTHVGKLTSEIHYLKDYITGY
jgi:signal-transduction protein with cAMP-binding, CBS, and nucleotidyltransferase domain